MERAKRVVQRIYLAVVGLVLAGAGVLALINPHGLAASLGIAALGVPGEVEIRAMYGGLSVGWGALLLFGLRYRLLAISGLAFTVIGGGCLLLARFATALAFGTAAFGGTVTSLILIEVLVVGLGYALLRQAIHTKDLPEAVQ